ncbi:hypothetical protein SCUCBS95973_002406 [Sporothrix curviconia]|uniref:AAA+ ATPase domain-containing protein n=1 Tax=Sporothrix curviconia TaxID=1260050 RepID=A0ABP0B6M7_9PEZI
MASEPPGGGQQKKLHPLFAPQTAIRGDSSNGTGASVAAVAPAGEAPVVPQQAAPEPAPRQDVPPMFLQRQTTPPQLPASEPSSLLPQTAQPEPGPSGPPRAELVPVPAAQPAPMNAFDMLKRKPVEPPAETLPESIPQAAEPKRRGRPPKKRKSSPPAPNSAPLHDADTSLPHTPGFDNSGNSESVASTSSHHQGSVVPNESTTRPGPEQADPATSTKSESTATEPPRRVLRLNPKTGTIGSPPNPKDATPPKASKAKGKAASSASGPLVFPYPAQDDMSRLRIGILIESVLSSKTRVQPQKATPPKPAKARGKSSAAPELKQLQSIAPMPTPPPKSMTTTGTTATTTTTAKSTHPFFTGARTKGAAAKDGSSGTPTSAKSSAGGSTMNYYTSTPCSPKRRGTQAGPMFRMPQFGAKNGILRVPGARLPAWPWKGAVHIHPDGSSPSSHRSSSSSADSASLPPLPPPRKQKGLAVAIHNDELILEQKRQSLNIASVIQDIRNANADEFAPPPPELRLPQRHIESGPRLQARIAPQLRTNDPGLNALFTSISTSLSAFDQHQCESLSWVQKYAPSCAIEVLQAGQEPAMLRNWLEALKVVSVDTGSGDAGDARGAIVGGAKGRPKKKRRKNKLDGFIVSSDDDDDGTGETSENEADWSASGRYGLVKNTVVSSGSLLGARLTNAVVISGPHGCGKSAAVYAVAKELGFEVFEINASSRRSGKDVIDRIGDMTKNHLVQHKKKKQPKAVVQQADTSEPVDDYDLDLEDADGEPDPDYPMPEVEVAAPTKKQPTMGSFFKTTSGAPLKQPDQSTEPTTKASQKQSLILLEEADLLYEEDKQFWATVMSLMAQSKRPFVITCNDETLLPLQTLRLHAIFRFTPPPTPVAVDRLIMIAASEGHALQRRAVQSLYEVRNRDFRAALVDLQFWCQIGVGDRRGGFDWFLQRWPDGVDIDENGHVMRVVSADTYQEGMGWLNNDAAAAGAANTAGTGSAGLALAEQGQVEDDLVQQAWNDWQLDMGQWQDSLDLASWASQLPSTTTKAQRRQMLEAYDNFTDAMSDADLVSSLVFTTGNRVLFDATVPELPSEAYGDYILGQQLLERTTVAHELDDLRLPMATAMRCSAKRTLQAETSEMITMPTGTLDALDATRVTSSIRTQHAEPEGLVPSDTPIIRRIDFSLAFDPIAVPSSAQPSAGTYTMYYAPSTTITSPSHLDPSVFDRNMTPIAVDVAPFVRGIIAYEGRLQKYRKNLSSLLSEASAPAPLLPVAAAAGATSDSDSEAVAAAAAAAARRRPAKRQRTTRAAMSALEGGSRSAVRKERWFDNADVNPMLVMRTGGDGWDGIVEGVLQEMGIEASAADARDAAAAAARVAEEAAVVEAARAEEARLEAVRVAEAARLEALQAAHAAATAAAPQQPPQAMFPQPMAQASMFPQPMMPPPMYHHPSMVPPNTVPTSMFPQQMAATSMAPMSMYPPQPYMITPPGFAFQQGYVHSAPFPGMDSAAMGGQQLFNGGEAGPVHNGQANYTENGHIDNAQAGS